jgi:hypothetical protein
MLSWLAAELGFKHTLSKWDVQILVGKRYRERERPPKRHMHSSEDNVKVDHKAIGLKVVKSIYFA